LSTIHRIRREILDRGLPQSCQGEEVSTGFRGGTEATQSGPNSYGEFCSLSR
jgi:hypothetical protein